MIDCIRLYDTAVPLSCFSIHVENIIPEYFLI